MSLIKSLSELKKGKWYHSPNLWAIDRPNAVEMNAENASFIQSLIKKKILFTTPDEAMDQAVSVLHFIGGDFEQPKEVVKKSHQDNDTLDLFGGAA